MQTTEIMRTSIDRIIKIQENADDVLKKTREYAKREDFASLAMLKPRMEFIIRSAETEKTVLLKRAEKAMPKDVETALSAEQQAASAEIIIKCMKNLLDVISVSGKTLRASEKQTEIAKAVAFCQKLSGFQH